jgi:hypothetical protein
VFEHVVFERVEPLLELVDLRAVVVDHRVHDPVQQGGRALAQEMPVAGTDIADPAH